MKEMSKGHDKSAAYRDSSSGFSSSAIRVCNLKFWQGHQRRYAPSIFWRLFHSPLRRLTIVCDILRKKAHLDERYGCVFLENRAWRQDSGLGLDLLTMRNLTPSLYSLHTDSKALLGNSLEKFHRNEYTTCDTFSNIFNIALNWFHIFKPTEPTTHDLFRCKDSILRPRHLRMASRTRLWWRSLRSRGHRSEEVV